MSGTIQETDHNTDVASLGIATAVPRHIAIVMDGNGRWAQARNSPRITGHKKGLQVMRDIVTACVDEGVSYLTVFAFSSENWRRPESEVRFLVDLFGNALVREVNRLHKNNIRFRVIGDSNRFGAKIARLIEEGEQRTAANNACTLTVAANYGGRWDLTTAFSKLAKGIADGSLPPENISESMISEHLSTAGLPDPDLFIRTGGEIRISNFMLWQLAYSELYFTDVLWPDFDRDELKKAIDWYGKRQRRFGKTGEQLRSPG